MLQLADHVAHAVYLLYERRDASLMKRILDRFHAHGGIIHGLVHVSAAKGASCECPACVSRHKPGTSGSWV